MNERKPIARPCADVQSVAWMSKASKHTPIICRDVTINVPYDRCNYDDLVFRTDMEAQVARVEAEKDAEIARLREVLEELKNTSLAMRGHIEPGAPVIDFALAIERAKHVLSEIPSALNEGAAG